MTMEAEMGEMLPQSSASGVIRSWKRQGADSPLEPQKGVWPHWHLHLEADLQYSERIAVYCFKPRSL